MPPWVRHQFPKAGHLVRHLRDEACADQGCAWCQERHNPSRELKRFFGFDGFRPEPTDDDGRPLQQLIVEAAMQGRNALGILPTGTGKSLCYQIPALSRYDKTGALTVVISPLVALMADQVAGLEKYGITSCVAVNGLLSMPERADALERVRLGDVAIVLISPEQLRNRSLRRALQQREIGAWVLDEAHCLSKWGHDFRPDYRYVGRFISEKAGTSRVPPVLCLTATAKPAVTVEILDYFRKELDINMEKFDGGSKRKNLDFDVVRTDSATKFVDIHRILTHHLPPEADGGAIVYCATRRATEEVANFLNESDVDADRFHAGLPPEEKKDIQQSFIEGRLRVIAATNAFGMGIDKPDVRLVIHADIPSSLENYLQEAGRAGRDQEQAHCVLLYTADDVERQFGMSARSRLTRREIHGVLRALRSLNRRDRWGGEVVATSGEILGEDEEQDFRRDSATDDTRVRTAVAWLEEAELLTREENDVRVFPSSLRVNSLEQVRERLQDKPIDEQYRRRLTTIAEELINAKPDEGISTDMLMVASGLSSEQVRGALHDLEQFGIATDDTQLTAFVHVGVRNPSHSRLTAAIRREQHLIELMQEMAPDLAVGEKAPLNLRIAAQRLRDDGHDEVRPEHVSRIIQGIAGDGRGDTGGGSLTVRKHDPDSVQVTLKREWSSLAGIAERRRNGASRLLEHLLSLNPPNRRGNDLLVATTLGKLTQAVEGDLTQLSQNGDERKLRRLMQRSLLWLHEQEVIRLNRGLAVFHPAMTIRLSPEPRGFRQTDFESLAQHYEGSVRQIHVMAEFAQRGLASMADALRLALDYFTVGEEAFLRRWLPERERELGRQTTPESWNNIVESLNNPKQRALVADNRETTNVLVLAGPGAGKTRVLVHRIAYLIRARREDPRGILALAYNRHAAIEIRRRLRDLIGDDARGVMVFTCHALAMRLVGASFSGQADRATETDLSERLREILREATALLRGEGLESEEAEESRARLLAGFRWILVDEYQDIDGDTYDLISALAGRTLSEEDARLSLFAVGDDDQNIYSFNGSSVRFIRRFEQDYNAKPAFLIDNYRSTGHIIDAANAVIGLAGDRMKADHAIRVNRKRAKAPAGGGWAGRDPVAGGKVQVLRTADDSAVAQAQTAVAELRRLSSLDPDWGWSKCAVIAREWSYLEPVRIVCERDGIPVQTANEGNLSLWHLRETQALVSWVRQRGPGMLPSVDLQDWLDRQPSGPWIEMLRQAAAEHSLETAAAEVPTASFIEWLAEWARDARRRQHGLLLLTAHRAKGLEFDHVVVLDGGWDRANRNEDPDAPRRLYYVAMTRARQTLALARLPGLHRFQDALGDNPSVQWRDPMTLPPPTPDLARRYRRLTLSDVYLSFAGYKPPTDPTQRAIAELAPGDRLQVRPKSDRWELRNYEGVVVGTLASKFESPTDMRCAGATVLAIATWSRDRSDPQYQKHLKSDTWEVVVPELVFEPAGSDARRGRA
ncbi:MAG: RecQ family ATP-dependent DNA helicase [bacterium]|nr:RecQ family ATP-dependent DNA helicase [bacterium]